MKPCLKQFTVESVTRYKDKGVGVRLVTVKEQTFDQWMKLAEWQFKPVDVALYPENGLVKAVQEGVAPEDDSQVTAEKEEQQPFTCFNCGDGNTPLYCMNCAEAATAKRTGGVSEILVNALMHLSKDELFKLHKKIGDRLPQEGEAPPKPKTEKGERSPSQRLRDVIFKCWEYVDKSVYPDFEGFYQSAMESLILEQKENLKGLVERGSY